MDINSLRMNFPEFTYRTFNWKTDGRDLLIRFQMGNSKYIFSPSLIIKNVNTSFDNIERSIIDNLVFHLGLAEIFTYWKPFCSPIINVEVGYLDDQQLKFWRVLFEKGMGQYYFENRIDFTVPDFLKIKTNNDPQAINLYETQSDNVLIAIGGGKDSATTLDIIADKFKTDNISAFTLNEDSYPAITKIIAASGNPRKIVVQRKIDPLLLKLNRDGFPNGHTPFSSYLAFLSVLISVVTNSKDIIFSNERSSNEGNAEYLGQNINHQYSKSLEFEKDFREYNGKYLSTTNYFSLMRPLYELQISKLFAGINKYHSLFISCNRGKTQWCGKCPKCASTFLGLYPFLENMQMKVIFGKNLFEDPEMVETYRRMADPLRIKPFECVGTLEETRIALYLSYKKDGKNANSALMNYFQKELLPLYDNWDEKAENLLKSWDKENYLNGEYTVILKNAYV